MSGTPTAGGPLHGVRVIELAGLGPAPFGAMVLGDLGAEVIRIDRPGGNPAGLGATPGMEPYDVLNRNRRSVVVDLKADGGVDVVTRLVAGADVFVEGFRPGVAERLGLGPDVLMADHPGLVYARMTGWGRTGPLADRAGHDIDYLALAGVQAHIGRAGEAPTPPLNLVADFGGGGMLLALGVVSALFERSRSGLGQVVDAAMIDGAALLMAPLFGAAALDVWGARGTNLLDSGAPFYDCYETSDGEWMAVGAIEPAFWAALLDGLDLDPAELPDQHDQARWPELAAALAQRFRTRTRTEWRSVFDHTDACVAPVLDMSEAPTHEHHLERATFVDVGGVAQPAPAPRFGRTPSDVPTVSPAPGADSLTVLAEAGLDAAEVERLAGDGVIGEPPVS